MYWAGSVGCHAAHNFMSLNDSGIVGCQVQQIALSHLLSLEGQFLGACCKNGKMVTAPMCASLVKSNLSLRVCSATHCSWFHGETFSETSATLWYTKWKCTASGYSIHDIWRVSCINMDPRFLSSNLYTILVDVYDMIYKKTIHMICNDQCPSVASTNLTNWNILSLQHKNKPPKQLPKCGFQRPQAPRLLRGKLLVPTATSVNIVHELWHRIRIDLEGSQKEKVLWFLSVQFFEIRKSILQDASWRRQIFWLVMSHNYFMNGHCKFFWKFGWKSPLSHPCQ